MNRVLILSAGNFGREVLDWLRDIPEEERDWEIGGFLDSRSSVLDGFQCEYGILGDPFSFELRTTDRVVCAIGEPKPKLEYCRALKAKGAEFMALVHPTAVIGSRCTIGDGCVVCPGAIVSTGAQLGNYATLNLNATVGHDAVIGDGCTLSPHADVTGWAVLGEGVFMGSHASVLPRVEVGAYAVVGAGSVAVTAVKAGATVFGVPARQVLSPR